MSCDSHTYLALLFACWVFFHAFVVFCFFFPSKLTFSKNHYRNWNTIRVSNDLDPDPDQDQQNDGPDLGSNCLQRIKLKYDLQGL